MSETQTPDDDDDENRSRDKIALREYERRQLVEYVPQIIDLYEDRELADDDRNLVERFEEMYGELQAEIDGTEQSYDFGAANWRDLAMALEELDDMRASWLRAKIGRRAELSAIQMGFTTNIPFMSMVTGETPTRPE